MRDDHNDNGPASVTCQSCGRERGRHDRDYHPARMLDEGGFELSSEYLRNTADELDPPQPEWPEWHDGYLVRDRDGDLWELSLGLWYCQGTYCNTESLTRHHSPLTRVLTYDPATQRIADPAKQEVVVSIEGLRKDVLRRLAQSDELEPYADSYACRTLTRVAKAVQDAGLLDGEA